MEAICLHEPAFYSFIDHVVARLKVSDGEKTKRIDDVEAMKMLNIAFKNTLQKLRDEVKSHFTAEAVPFFYHQNHSVFLFL